MYYLCAVYAEVIITRYGQQAGEIINKYIKFLKNLKRGLSSRIIIRSGDAMYKSPTLG